MAKICFINGSPKTGESCSLYLIDYIWRGLQNTFKEKLIINALELLNKPNKHDLFENILSCKLIVIVFPLYVDSLPSSLLEALVNLEAYKKQHAINDSNPLALYALANCGFIEGHQNKNALSILENYCLATGFKWCGGIGLGGGEMIRSTKDQIPLNSKVARPVYDALCLLINSIKELDSLPYDKKIIFGNYKFPKWFFILMGNKFWLVLAKKNNVTKKLMYARIAK
ncbi:hypothetical protein [Cellulosilyticum sp. I15G10I2]|uniref:hypothetical protein n=1 Tax=Cellulosilyticum sp. I15G10I2 TaxID=1892843 RepID=UPI00085C9675|nr:hypothetical protein [Cellulosilyticum sp. I15G10I2]